MLPYKKHKGKCSLAVDSGRLFHLVCTRKNCPGGVDMSRVKTEYLWCRRRTRKTLGLLSVSTPLDAHSFVAFDQMAKSCGIVSNTNTAHVTLLEGYPLWQDDYSTWLSFTLDQLVLLRESIQSNPFVTIQSLEKVPRNDKETVLILATISPSFTDEVKAQLTEKCLLPQFPLHLAVGACQVSSANEALAKAKEQMIGLTFQVDASFLAVIAPSLGDKFISDFHCPKTYDKRRKTSDALFGGMVNAAASAASEMNMALYQSSACVDSK